MVVRPIKLASVCRQVSRMTARSFERDSATHDDAIFGGGGHLLASSCIMLLSEAQPVARLIGLRWKSASCYGHNSLRDIYYCASPGAFQERVASTSAKRDVFERLKDK
jgi:hypothetical protein